MFKAFRLFFVLVFVLLQLVSCKKDSLLTDGGNIHFSTDTLTFDTVFTSLGSFTVAVKILNQQDQKIKISSVRVAGGNSSFFKLNVNGVSGQEVRDMEIAARDSMYVFATVNIDPSNANNPFVVEDRLVATLNGREFSIPMIAYGQNAYYYIDTVIDQNTTWLTDKPYVIIRNALVSEGKTLTIPAGCRIYMHADSRLFVAGTLKALGTKADSIVFQGDRLDRAYFGYEGYPGEWGGLYFTSKSTANELHWTIIKNCGSSTRLGSSVLQAAAIQVNPDSVADATPQLFLNHTIIENSFGFGILSFFGSIQAQNSLIHTTGSQAIGLLQGGDYQFDNCSIVNYFPKKVNHTQEPSVAVLNYFDISQTEYVAGDLRARFRNCLIYGSLDNELFVNQRSAGPAALYDVSFTNCFITRKDALPPYVTATNCLFNQDAKLVDYRTWNYRPTVGSPLLGAGTAIPGLGSDLDDKPWQTPFAIGAYQEQ